MPSAQSENAKYYAKTIDSDNALDVKLTTIRTRLMRIRKNFSQFW